MTEQQQLARGKNIMLDLLEKRLSVPKIYLDASWQGHRVDILAVDRDGSGDVHVVLAYIRPVIDGDLPNTLHDRKEIERLLGALTNINAQYKYVLGVAPTPRWAPFGDAPASDFESQTFSPDGLGRAALAFAAPDKQGIMKIKIAIFPERFRAFVGASAEEFIKTHPADWEMRA